MSLGPLYSPNPLKRRPQSLQVFTSSVMSSPIQKSGKQKTSMTAKTIQPATEIWLLERGRAVLPQLGHW
jgi:6-phosphogluconolactonase/glucosamine-6-phosphate isomerase/deaminase